LLVVLILILNIDSTQFQHLMLSLINFVSFNLKFVFFLGHGWFIKEE